MEQPKRKKGGAEKLCAKRVKNLTVDATKCAKITDMFAGGAAVASTASETATNQQQQVEGEGVADNSCWCVGLRQVRA